MKTKKQLRIELEKAHNEIAHLKTDLAMAVADRADLANELSDPVKKADRELYLALTNNLTKSLNQKNAINMKPDEKDAVYYLMERLLQILEIGEKSLSFYNPLWNNLSAYPKL